MDACALWYLQLAASRYSLFLQLSWEAHINRGWERCWFSVFCLYVNTKENKTDGRAHTVLWDSQRDVIFSILHLQPAVSRAVPGKQRLPTVWSQITIRWLITVFPHSSQQTRKACSSDLPLPEMGDQLFTLPQPQLPVLSGTPVAH